MAADPERRLFKGPLMPIKEPGRGSHMSYSQPASTKGEVWFEKKAKEKAAKGWLFREPRTNQRQESFVLIIVDIIFSSSKIPQPFLDPKSMAQRPADAQQKK